MMQPTLDTLQPSLEAMTPVLDDLIEQLESSMKGSGKCRYIINLTSVQCCTETKTVIVFALMTICFIFLYICYISRVELGFSWFERCPTIKRPRTI